MKIKKMEAIQKWPRSTTPTEIHSFWLIRLVMAFREGFHQTTGATDQKEKNSERRIVGRVFDC